jgi:hypothetical protein
MQETIQTAGGNRGVALDARVRGYDAQEGPGSTGRARQLGHDGAWAERHRLNNVVRA